MIRYNNCLVCSKNFSRLSLINFLNHCSSWELLDEDEWVAIERKTSSGLESSLKYELLICYNVLELDRI